MRSPAGVVPSTVTPPPCVERRKGGRDRDDVGPGPRNVERDDVGDPAPIRVEDGLPQRAWAGVVRVPHDERVCRRMSERQEERDDRERGCAVHLMSRPHRGTRNASTTPGRAPETSMKVTFLRLESRYFVSRTTAAPTPRPSRTLSTRMSWTQAQASLARRHRPRRHLHESGLTSARNMRVTTAKKNAVDHPHIRMPVSASIAPTSRHSCGSTMSP